MILTFDTTHHALWAEEIALARGLGVDVIPAPADSGAKCDLALEVLPEDGESLVAALLHDGVPHRIYAP
jgi:hypothetical protein